jgi:Leucine-rich repeat (LRR) protein
LVELSENLVELPSLKYFNLENNTLTQIPSNLSQCVKLKDLLMKENKLKDNRLKKLVEQDKVIFVNFN